MEHIAAELGLNPAEVKQRNFIGAPDNSEADPLAPAGGHSASPVAADNKAAASDAAQGSGVTTAAAPAFSIAADGTPEVAEPPQRQRALASDSAAAASDSAKQRPCFGGLAEGLAAGEQVGL